MIKRFLSTNSKFPIVITNNAWIKIRNILTSSENHYGFLFYASSGGCNGFNYNLELLDENTFNELNESKINLTINDDYNNKVYIDPASEFYFLYKDRLYKRRLQ